MRQTAFCPERARGKSRHRRSWRAAPLAALLVASAHTATAQSTFNANFDYYSYPFIPNGGTATSAANFGAFNDSTDVNGFDNRDAQFFFGFNTSSGAGAIPAGLPLLNYNILSAKITLTVGGTAGVATKVYDGTRDLLNTYGPGGAHINGDDAGRPVELYGVGFRNGLTSSTITESAAFSIPGPDPANPKRGIRSIYSSDFKNGVSINGSSRDVSNNVDGLGAVAPFDPVPFSIGQVDPSSLDANGKILPFEKMTFTLDLGNQDLINYLRLALQEGRLFFATSSLEESPQSGGPSTLIRFFTKENTQLEDGPILELNVQIVPEPATSAILLTGVGLCLGGRRSRRNETQTQTLS